MPKLSPSRLQDLMRYAVAVAGNLDDPRSRELGPIHLLKYAYLGDLAHAEREGATFTGCPWRFHHFGPYAVEAWKQVEPAMNFSGIHARSFNGKSHDDDVQRYRALESRLEVELEGKLPLHVARRIKRSVTEFANDTPALLHYVYRTPPMLKAAPQEILGFADLKKDSHPSTGREAGKPPLSKTAQKRKNSAHAEIQSRFQAALAAKTATKTTPTAKLPRYDQIFQHGVAWLDEQAGEPIRQLQGEMLISDGIWKSGARSEPEIP